MSYLELFLPLALIAGFLRGLTGFGGPLVLVPAFVFFLKPASAAAIVLMVDSFSNLGILREALRLAGRRTVTLTLVGGAVAMPLGSLILVNADIGLVRDLIYAAVGCAALVLLAGLRFPRPLKSYELGASGGLAGGIMGATALGILIVPILFSMPDDAQTSRANIIVWVFAMNLVLIALLMGGGQMTKGDFAYAAVLAPAYLIGALIGKRSFGYVNEVLFRRIVLGFLLIFSTAGLLFG